MHFMCCWKIFKCHGYEGKTNVVLRQRKTADLCYLRNKAWFLLATKFFGIAEGDSGSLNRGVFALGGHERGITGWRVDERSNIKAMFVKLVVYIIFNFINILIVHGPEHAVCQRDTVDSACRRDCKPRVRPVQCWNLPVRIRSGPCNHRSTLAFCSLLLGCNLTVTVHAIL